MVLPFLLSESSGGLGIIMDPKTHKIVKMSLDYDIEKDKDNLLAVPLEGTLSVTELLASKIDMIYFEIKDFRSTSSKNTEELKYMMKSRDTEIGTLKNQVGVLKDKIKKMEKENYKIRNDHYNMEKENYKIKNDHCRIKYYFGTLMIIKIWIKIERGKYIRSQSKKKRKSPESPKILPFPQFFSNFIYQDEEHEHEHENQTMKERLDLSTLQIKKIRKLVRYSNISAHGENEFFSDCKSGSPRARDQVSMLKEILKEAETYDEKDPEIIKLAKAFLKNIQNEYLH